MNNLATIKYSLKISMIQLSPFYVTVIALECLYIIMKMTVGIGTMSMGTWDIMAAFVATAIPCGFHERFRFFIQNGFSRKTIFINFIIAFLVSAFAMAAFETLVVMTSDAIGLNYKPIFSALYQYRYTISSASILLEGTLWHFFLFLAAMCIAFPFSIAFHQMTKFYRSIVFIVIPSILFLGFPLVDYAISRGSIIQEILTFLLKVFGLYETINPMLALIPLAIISSIGLIASYFLMKRANLQK